MADHSVTLKMPVPFKRDGLYRHSIIYPDRRGQLHVKYLHGIKLSCTTAKFASTDLKNHTEALVICAGDNLLWYRGQKYEYEDFMCDAMPKSELRVTGDTCQPNNYTVVAVGFKTKSAYLDVYRVCFDNTTKNSLYSWYDSRSPYYNVHQSMRKRPPFNATTLYGKTNVNQLYTISQQVSAIILIDNQKNLIIDVDKIFIK